MDRGTWIYWSFRSAAHHLRQGKRWQRQLKRQFSTEDIRSLIFPHNMCGELFLSIKLRILLNKEFNYFKNLKILTSNLITKRVICELFI